MSVVLVFLFILVAFIASCASGPFPGAVPGARDPYAILIDRTGPPKARLALAHTLGPLAASTDADRYRAALNAIAWSDGQPLALRCWAIDRLAQADGSRFVPQARAQIDRVDDWGVLKHLFEVAADHHWRSFTATAIASWMRPSRLYDDDHRPERRLIAALNPGRNVTDVVYETFLGMTDHPSVADQAAAWTLLRRLLDADRLRALLAAAPGDNALVRDVQAAAGAFDVLPVDGEQLLWLTALRQADGGREWAALAKRIAALNPEQRRGLALRHATALLTIPSAGSGGATDNAKALRSDVSALDAGAGNTDKHARRLASLVSGTRAPSGGQLLQSLRAELAGRTFVPRTERLPEQEVQNNHALDRLCWGDLLTLHLIVRALDDPRVVAALLQQAAADRRDRTSEHGGALLDTDGRWQPVAFAPASRGNDHAYVASLALMTALYHGLAHYHFHAQSDHNAPFAGPGGGDLAFARRFGFNCLVLTAVAPGVLDVDYYQPNGLVVDLGEIQSSHR